MTFFDTKSLLYNNSVKNLHGLIELLLLNWSMDVLGIKKNSFRDQFTKLRNVYDVTTPSLTDCNVFVFYYMRELITKRQNVHSAQTHDLNLNLQPGHNQPLWQFNDTKLFYKSNKPQVVATWMHLLSENMYFSFSLLCFIVHKFFFFPFIYIFTHCLLCATKTFQKQKFFRCVRV